MRFLILPPITMLLTGAVMVALNNYLPMGRAWTAPFSYLGVMLMGAGISIAHWHARLFKRVGANIQTFGEPSALTREGLFRHTRNPMYLGFVLALLGLAVLLGSVSPFLALALYAALVNWWYIPFEEKALRRKFGDEYLRYCRQVRRWI